jgi:hypothetical protein
LLVLAALAAVGGSLASDRPDGLQRVARDQGFAGAERDHALDDGPLADYSVEGVTDEKISTGLSGIAGMALVFAAATAVGAVVQRRRTGGRS